MSQQALLSGYVKVILSGHDPGSYFLGKFIPATCPLFSFLRGVSGHGTQQPCLTQTHPQILEYERTLSVPARLRKAKELYDKFIYAEMLAMDSVSRG